ncbi:hypothetical protein [Brevundimonas sp.]|uniref:hypothetical protein n=1 Tax=Brevundimonas sp. TaxID=1871086 RepID=UPI0027308FE7|nr:hypothetical protein [Brevundimonas sp.]MDP1912320.1 hypothetical protein [Brevundimonas sp.]
MTVKSNDPAVYFRTGIAIPVDRKPLFESRLKELGMTTTGDLVTFFILAEGVVEALKPLANKFAEQQRTKKTPAALRREATEALKDMSPEEIQRLIAAARMSPTGAQ